MALREAEKTCKRCFLLRTNKTKHGIKIGGLKRLSFCYSIASDPYTQRTEIFLLRSLNVNGVQRTIGRGEPKNGSGIRRPRDPENDVSNALEALLDRLRFLRCL